MARVDLGLSDEQFGRLTPGELAVFRERIDVRERRADARAALIVKTMGVREMSLEEIIAALTLLPETPHIPTAEELEALKAQERAEFDKALES